MSGGKVDNPEPKARNQDRRARQAEALRANLRKRKAQARARDGESGLKAPKKADCNQS